MAKSKEKLNNWQIINISGTPHIPNHNTTDEQ